MLPRAARTWISTSWPYAGATAGVFMLALIPLLWRAWPLYLLAIFLQLPIYIVHQVEEHYHDRFRTFVNQHFAHGRDALTTPAVVFINLGGVWLVDLVALYLSYFVDPAYGLIAIYLALINAIGHIIVALILRAYNPGLITAFFLLLPGSLIGGWIIIRQSHPSLTDHLEIAGFVLLIHIVIVASIVRRVRKLSTPPFTQKS